jgi:hypothetical protein
MLLDAEKFAEWVLAHERKLESARAGDRVLDPVCLFLNSLIRRTSVPSNI